MKTMVVRQEEEIGCGIAAVANVVGVSYSDVKSVANSIGIFAEDVSLFSDTEYVRKLLETYNVRTASSEELFISWDLLPDVALLSIRHHVERGRSYWHWVVFKRIDAVDFVFDSAASLANNLRTDFDAMQPKWSIEILDRT